MDVLTDSAPASITRRLFVDPIDIERLIPAWRALADHAARTPFESPDWLVPWWRHYGGRSEARFLTWWRESNLVGVAPLLTNLTRRGGLSLRELAFWGAPPTPPTPLRGWVDVLVAEDDRRAILEDFVDWLAEPTNGWHLFHYLRLPTGSSTAAELRGPRRPWWAASLTGIVDSTEFVLQLPEPRDGWAGPLGPKARHNVRTEIRAFEKRPGGSIERITDPDAAEYLVTALRLLTAEHWGPSEAQFRRDPAFEDFLIEAVRAAFTAGEGYAFIARDAAGIEACLLTLQRGRIAVPVLVGVTSGAAYSPMSLGKCLFSLAIDEAVSRDCTVFDFLQVGGYKETFWHATGRILESGLLGRGIRGRGVTAYVLARRQVLPALARRAARAFA
jgi:CelD/BcsL family acetyltransferase involved in cellulose biosynthesis